MSEFSNQVNATSEPKKKKKRGGLALIIGGAVLAAAVGGVFATNVISINSAGGIQLGNGVAETVSCTNSATTTVNQTWDGTAGDAGDFVVSSVEVSGLANCLQKTLKVVLIGSDGSAICGVDGTHSTDTYDLSDPPVLTNSQDSFYLGSSSFSFSLLGSANLGCLSSSVAKVGLETAD